MASLEPAAQPIACPICATPSAFSFSKSGYAIFRCPGCDFRFVHPPPSDTSHLYGEDYFHGASRGFGYVNYEEDKVAMRSFFLVILDAIEYNLPSRGRLLDVGAATGFFLKLAAERGWAVAGLEVSDYAVRIAERSGLPVAQGTLEAARFPDNFFDAVVLLDVIEHVAEPGRLVAQVSRLLRPGGVVAINTPDTASWWARVLAERWHAYCPPEHLSYFNRSNLSRLLEASGFTVVFTVTLPKRFTPAYVFSMLHRWQGLRVWRCLEQAFKASRLNRLSLPLNLRDNFFLIARKR